MDLFKSMIITPMSTMNKAVNQLLSDPSLTGRIAVTHENDVTLVQPPPYVSEGTRKNLDTFWQLLGYNRGKDSLTWSVAQHSAYYSSVTIIL